MKKSLILLILLLLAAAFAFSLWKLWGIYHFYENGKREYDELTEYVEQTGKGNTADGSPENSGDSGRNGEDSGRNGEGLCPVSVDFEGLLQINPDVVGWICIPDTVINYPIVQSKDNALYLKRTFRGENSYIGAIFLDASNSPGFDNDNSILYGHNLKNGEMFGSLKKLYDTESGRGADPAKHPVIWIVTPDESMKYQVFAARRVRTQKDQDAYTIDFPDREKYKKFLEAQADRSAYRFGTVPSEEEGMLTLSTCTSTGEDERFIVQAARVTY